MSRPASELNNWDNGQHEVIGPDTVVYKIGLYGWRKRCLYCLVVVMLVILIINLALTIWILRVLDFNIHGMGLVRITESGMRVEGDSEFVNPVHVKTVMSRQDEPLLIHSDTNVTISAPHVDDMSNGVENNRLVIGDEVIDAVCNQFTVHDQHGKQMLAVNNEQIALGVKQLSVQGDGGSKFSGSIQTPLIQSEPFKKLRLESPSQSVRIDGIKSVDMTAHAGDINMNCRDDITLQSHRGKLMLDSGDIRILNIPESNPVSTGRTHNNVYQICVCTRNGRLFLAPPRQPCAATDDICDA